jgi:hypothetical protein
MKVCCLIKFHDTIQKIVNNGTNVNAKGENGKINKMYFAFSMWKATIIELL